MGFTGLFEIQGMLFSIMILGLLLKKKGVIRGQSQELPTNSVVYVTLPCSIVRFFEIEFDHEILVDCLIIPIATLGIQVDSYILSFILYPHMGERRKKVLQYTTICSNAGILGNLIVESVFGPLDLLYVFIHLIPQRIFMQPAGFTYFTEAPDRKTLVEEVTTHPCILAMGLGLVLMISGIRLPSVAKQTVRTLASVNTVLSILFIGSILAEVSFRSLWNHATLYCSLIRLTPIPCSIYLFCLAFHMKSVVTGVSVVLAGTPATNAMVILAAKYKRDAVFATECVVSSTSLSMTTIPVLCLMAR